MPLDTMYASGMPSRIPMGAPLANEAADVMSADRSPVMYNPAGLMSMRADARLFPVQAADVVPDFNLAVVPGSATAQRGGKPTAKPKAGAKPKAAKTAPAKAKARKAPAKKASGGAKQRGSR